MRPGARARIGTADYVVLALGFAVFAAVFNSGGDLVYSMAIGSSFLAAITVAVYGVQVKGLFNLGPAALALSPIYALALYASFYAGYRASLVLGMGADVEKVYSMVYPSIDRLALLALISLSEEVYWRGGVQELLVRRRMGKPWWLASIPYSLVHVSSGIPVLVPAALVAGLILGHAASRLGLAASTLAHYSWLLLMFRFLPVV
ncbi:MAG: CPBP family glutamic-type intramembrane protease [Desulfurococcales archaeon]|nr:CPBP family glutamic-type intramembrane protease [Desulfurococcales archaeon]